MPEACVAICMATYEPRREVLARQVESIRQQTHQKWHCWVVDDGSSPAGQRVVKEVLAEDPRFTMTAMSDNLGFYRNFERALVHVRGQAPWIALADQDDIWASHKLETLLAATGGLPTPALVYADVEIQDDAGRQLSPTYWVGRRHNEDDLAALLFANTVSGAASLLADDVLEIALPFPPERPSSFHDHWLALVARCVGRIAYVNEAVQAYVQHDSNAIGHQPYRVESGVRIVARLLSRAWWRRPDTRYFDDEVARLSDLARTLLIRTPELSRRDENVLRAVASLHDSRPALGWLAAQALRETKDPSVTMWRRRRVLASVLWSRFGRVQPAVGPGSTSS